MAGSSFYVARTTLESAREITVGGRSALDAYPALIAAIASRCGREVAGLLAEPVVTRGNQAAPTSISWYAGSDAEPRRLTSLDPEARRAAEATLRAQLAELARLLDDPEHGPLVGAALHVTSLDDIWVLDGRPLLTNWGILPEEAGRTAAARDAHFRKTLGGYMALAQAPALSAAEWQDRRGRAAAQPAPPEAVAPAAVTAAPAAAAAPVVASVAMPGEAAVVVVAAPWYRRPWLPVLAAVIVLALVLAYLLIPGTLLYPPQLAAEAPAADLDLRREANAALEERARQLRLALEQNACTAEGQLVAPGGGGEGDSRPLAPERLLPPPVTALTPPPEATPGGPAFDGSLVDLLDQTTALVIGVQGESDASIGSGFFVAPKLLVTNRHVVEHAKPDAIFVTNQALGGLSPARILHQTPDSEIGHPDYAVLEVPAAAGMRTLALTGRIGRLENVIAGGFPSIILDTDLNFQALKSGDAAAIPQLAVTQGVVTVVQNRGRDLPIVIHTADISPGNSGGPLIDACGRVVGINTFQRAEQETVSHLNYAIAADAIAAFLDANGVPHAMLDDECRPRIAMAPPTQETPPPAQEAPAPAPPPDGTPPTLDGTTPPPEGAAPPAAPN